LQLQAEEALLPAGEVEKAGHFAQVFVFANVPLGQLTKRKTTTPEAPLPPQHFNKP
jgi:hypothetical protein